METSHLSDQLRNLWPILAEHMETVDLYMGANGHTVGMWGVPEGTEKLLILFCIRCGASADIALEGDDERLQGLRLVLPSAACNAE